MKEENLIGKRFGRLIIIELDKERTKLEKERYENGEIKSAKIFWKCKCDCGNYTSATYSNLNSSTKSCGCLRREYLNNTRKQNKYEFIENNIVKGWDAKHENFFLIDKEDYENIKSHCWHKDGKGYWSTNIHINNKKTLRQMHQFIGFYKYNNLYDTSLYIIDHLNRNKDDNRRCNLELKTQAENNRNFSKNKSNTSGKQGVYYNKKSNKWIAQINIEIGKRKHIGSFDTYEEAVNARKQAEIENNYIGD